MVSGIRDNPPSKLSWLGLLSLMSLKNSMNRLHEPGDETIREGGMSRLSW